MILAAALATFGFIGIAYAQSAISKALTTVTGPDNTDPVPLGLGDLTIYGFIPHYDSNGGPAVTIRDTIPNGFDTVTAQDDNCKPLTVYSVPQKVPWAGGDVLPTRLHPTLDTSFLSSHQPLF